MITVDDYVATTLNTIGVGFIKVDSIKCQVGEKPRKVSLPVYHCVCVKYYIPSITGEHDESHVGYKFYCMELQKVVSGNYDGTKIKPSEIFKTAYIEMVDVVSEYIGELFRVKKGMSGSFTDEEYQNLFSELHQLAKTDEKVNTYWDIYHAGVMKLSQDGVEFFEEPSTFTSWGYKGDVKVSFSPWQVTPDDDTL